MVFTSAVLTVVPHLTSSNVAMQNVVPASATLSTSAILTTYLRSERKEFVRALTVIVAGTRIDYQLHFLMEALGYTNSAIAISSVFQQLNNSIHSTVFDTLLRQYAVTYSTPQLFTNVTSAAVILDGTSTVEVLTNPTDQGSTTSKETNSSWPVYAKVIFPLGLLFLIVISGIALYQYTHPTLPNLYTKKQQKTSSKPSNAAKKSPVMITSYHHHPSIAIPGMKDTEVGQSSKTDYDPEEDEEEEEAVNQLREYIHRKYFLSRWFHSIFTSSNQHPRSFSFFPTTTKAATSERILITHPHSITTPPHSFQPPKPFQLDPHFIEMILSDDVDVVSVNPTDPLGKHAIQSKASRARKEAMATPTPTPFDAPINVAHENALVEDGIRITPSRKPNILFTTTKVALDNMNAMKDITTTTTTTEGTAKPVVAMMGGAVVSDVSMGRIGSSSLSSQQQTNTHDMMETDR